MIAMLNQTRQYPVTARGFIGKKLLDLCQFMGSWFKEQHRWYREIKQDYKF